jgi:hypothetical protein
MSSGNFLVPVGEMPPQYEGPDNLINGAFPQVRNSIQIVKDEPDLKRGSLLGIVSEGDEKGKYRLVKKDAKDGSIIPSCVLADHSKTPHQSPAIAYLSGQFNSRSIIIGAGLNILDFVTDLRKLSIFLSNSIGRPKL